VEGLGISLQLTLQRQGDGLWHFSSPGGGSADKIRKGSASRGKPADAPNDPRFSPISTEATSCVVSALADDKADLIHGFIGKAEMPRRAAYKSRMIFNPHHPTYHYLLFL
jgi:hypothetical protein